MKFRVIFSVLGLAAATLVFAQVPVPKFKNDRILVRYKPGITWTAIQTMNSGFGASLLWFDSNNRMASLKIPGTKTADQAITYYKSQSEIERAVKSMMLQKDFRPNDQMLGQQYGLTNVKAFESWDFAQGKSSVKIAIIDDGIQMDHPDLKNKIVDPYDVIDGDHSPNPAPGGNTHGTHTAGIAAAETNNGIGVASTGFKCRVMPIRVFDNSGFTSDDQMIQAMRWAIDHGAKVISMSIGGYDFTPAGNPLFQVIIDEAWTKNIIVVASAGNDSVETGSGLYHFPSDYNHVVSVASSDNLNLRSVFSNFGDVDVTAPGTDIMSTLINSAYGRMSGTSMSTPMVSGILGSMWSVAPGGATATFITDALYNTATPVGSFVKRGLVNMDKAVRRAAAITRVLGPIPGGVSEGSAFTDPGLVGAKDGLYYSLLPASVPGLGQVASSVFRFTIGNDVLRTQVIQLDVTDVAKFANGSTGQIYLFNWQTGKWVIWKSFQMNGTSTVTINQSLKSTFTTYISAAGEYRIMIRGLMPASAGVTGNSFDTDQLSSSVTYVALQ